MIIKVKKIHPDAVLPKNAHPSDSGYDVYAVEEPEKFDSYYLYKTGLKIEPPDGYDIKVFPRGSIAKTDLVIANSIGLCDNSYRGEYMVVMKFVPQVSTDNNGNLVIKNKIPNIYHKGDKIAQLVIQPVWHANFIEVKELSNTDRAEGRLGSTDKR
jgi:dUTP pyrophosphatase